MTHGIDIIDDPANPSAIYIHAINHAPSPHATSSPPGSLASPPGSLASPPGSLASLAPEDLVASRIEIFHHILGSNSARHIRTIHHPLIRTPNDIYSIAPGDLLVTNDHRYRAGFLRTLEDLISHPLGPKSDVVRVTFPIPIEHGSQARNAQHAGLEDGLEGGVVARIVGSGLHNPNGLGHGPDGEILLVDAAGGVLCFGSLTSSDDPNPAVLILNRSVSFPSTIDNPSPYTSLHNPSKKGILNAGLTAAHTLSTSARDPSGNDPSIIYYLPSDSSVPRVLFKDEGGRLLRSASAAVCLDLEKEEEEGGTWCFGTGFISEGIVGMRVVL